ncbi:hypothetical protein ACF9IK_20250 [Kitasatospora hibisci]|uniref:hypothetical protein n=1 Tax=Kitasatospora hibisci TaxID=3369522 RepID=UPI003753ED8D
MGRKRRLRRTVIDGDVRLWSVHHRHPDCREVLTVHREGGGTLRIVFRPGPGRFVPDGFLHSGQVADDRGGALNLHLPGAVRQLLDEARAQGLEVPDRGTAEADGWPLFDAATGADR